MNEANAEAPADRIYYEGHCGLCHLTVRFVLRSDRRGDESFRFAPHQGGARNSDFRATESGAGY